MIDPFEEPERFTQLVTEGFARAEWSGAAWEIVSNFDLGSRSVEVMAARASSDELHEITVPLAEPGGETKLGRFLTEHLAAMVQP